ncbi:uncharacterized protein DUF2029 [Sediminihabitans luteus]|uniref:Uncharacterized protein DUF2029 n=1 Tax=Sediminihabitans luteus TaxID=1138585 RepID=A0A2M9D0Z6_9CELL|nr:glycosyltransferase 87 family protein [Sediminihabitans luteus]PJJ77874.1 uncharacterized protein DUF2029 [Sediminihabitans luteus]GII99768.1 hypothetical protein Slu03_21460 [Sediminihabitans luteus]
MIETPARHDGPWSSRAARTLGGLPVVWIGFVLVHAVLVHQVAQFPGQLDGDVDLYRSWVEAGLRDGTWPVLDTGWVYPVGALVPITLPGLWSLDPEAYRVLFVAMVVALDGLAVGSLVRAGRGRTTGAWWWLVFLLALGPITLTRLDGVSAALTVIALAQLAPVARPRLASALATGAAWVKVAPGAVLVPLALVVRRPWRRVVLPAALVSAIVVGLALLGGAGARVLTFFGDQGSRGLQVEAVAATPFSLARLWSGEFPVVFDAPLKVLEITGPGTDATAAALDTLLLVAVAAVALATWRSAARLRRAVPDDVARRGPDLELVLLATLALSLCLVAFNKVGSPQYVTWFAPPVAVALAALGARGSRVLRPGTWTVLAAALLVVALLTHRLFPDHYDEFLLAVPLDTVLAAVRNALVLVLAVAAGVLVARVRVREGAGSAGDGPVDGRSVDDGAVRASSADDGDRDPGGPTT